MRKRKRNHQPGEEKSADRLDFLAEEISRLALQVRLVTREVRKEEGLDHGR